MSVHRPNVTKTKADRGVTSVTTGQRRPSPSDRVCSTVSRRQAQAARPAGKAPPGRPPHSASSPGWRQSAHCRRSGRAAAQPGGLPAQPWPRGDGRLPLRLRTYPRHLLVEGQNHIRSPKRNVRRLLWNAGGLGMEVSRMQMDRQCAGWRLSDPSRLCHMPSPAWAPARPGKSAGTSAPLSQRLIPVLGAQ